MAFLLRFTAVAASILAAGCGGGGSDQPVSPTSSVPTTTNVSAAYTALVRSAHSYSLAGSTSTGISLTATLSTAPGAQVTSNGTTYDTTSVTVSVFRAGVLQATGVTTAWQDVGGTNWAWSFQTPEGSCVVRTSSVLLPTSAALDQSGPFVSGTKYAGCSPGNLPRSFWTPVGTVAQTWSYRLIGGIPFVCIDSATTGAVGTETESDCIEVVDSSGTLGTRARVTTKDLNSVTTTLSN